MRVGPAGDPIGATLTPAPLPLVGSGAISGCLRHPKSRAPSRYSVRFASGRPMKRWN
jgi:hypothetical protein